MKKITVSFPDEVYRRATVRAADRNTSSRAIIQQLLSELGREETDFEGLIRLQDEVLASVRCFAAGERITRVEVHERR